MGVGASVEVLLGISVDLSASPLIGSLMGAISGAMVAWMVEAGFVFATVTLLRTF